MSAVSKAAKVLFGLLIAVFTFLSFWAPVAKDFRNPELFRIIFFHLPCDIATALFLAFGAYLSLRYLRERKTEWHARECAANDVAFLFALMAMATGILFSKAEWGTWWQWDPRQYSFLVVLLIYGAYFALRISFSSQEQARLISAAYSCVAIIPAFFLIFVFPRLPMIANDSFHPSNTITSGGFSPVYNMVIWPLVLLVIILGAWIYKVSVRAYSLEYAVQEHYGKLENRDGHSPVTGVVRPVSVSDES